MSIAMIARSSERIVSLVGCTDLTALASIAIPLGTYVPNIRIKFFFNECMRNCLSTEKELIYTQGSSLFKELPSNDGSAASTDNDTDEDFVAKFTEEERYPFKFR
ncbi:hypothetical protein NPIL_636381 [Nephila pilipes]|uniref:Uncharacterized protein n=1 Tax=Nephila pilipes TaxID=299642 RepID=A0A8X6NXN5_NEPPI|nr:hypothetical protein NPIL_390781 [Nephila pilipes]GFT41056.1 hypothetical protein NPIL_522761 [Nephila pilipes]GFU27309.1 hypothetical protein NPIL_636381 [Nephila pilipes]